MTIETKEYYLTIKVSGQIQQAAVTCSPAMAYNLYGMIPAENRVDLRVWDKSEQRLVQVAYAR